jgi:hypothetical protein
MTQKDIQMTDTDDDKLWQKFATKERAYKVIDFPRYDKDGKSIGKICIRTLWHSELQEIDLATAEDVDHLFLTDRKIWDQSSSIMVQRYNAREQHSFNKHLLQKIIVHPEQGKRDKLVYPTPEHVASYMTVPEAAKIMIEYYKLEEGRPSFSNLSLDKFNEWIDMLSKSLKKDQVSFLERLVPETLIELTTYLVALQSNSNQVNSSLSKQLNELLQRPEEASSPPMTTSS